MTSKIYLETTIISYLAARPSKDLITAAHQQVTHDWWQNRRRDFDLFSSQLVIQESSAGDATVAQARLQLLSDISLLQVNVDSVSLARALVEKGPIPEKAAVDALHIAVATVNGMDYLLTWNCKHIANAEMQTAVNRICRSAGYEPPVRRRNCRVIDLCGTTKLSKRRVACVIATQRNSITISMPSIAT